MKIAANIAGALLGLMFIAFSMMFFLHMMPAKMPVLPEHAAQFMGAVGPTGYMHFVKACELIGGLLVAVPLTRNFGLLFLGPVILNILAFHAFLTDRAGLRDPVLIVIVLLTLFLLWSGRRQFSALLIRAH